MTGKQSIAWGVNIPRNGAITLCKRGLGRLGRIVKTSKGMGPNKEWSRYFREGSCKKQSSPRDISAPSSQGMWTADESQRKTNVKRRYSNRTPGGRENRGTSHAGAPSLQNESRVPLRADARTISGCETLSQTRGKKDAALQGEDGRPCVKVHSQNEAQSYW